MSAVTAGARSWVTITAGAVVILSGAVVVLYFFQPWRSCDYEDTSAGCAMLPHDAAAMGVAVMACLASVGTLVAALTWPRSRPDTT